MLDHTKANIDIVDGCSDGVISTLSASIVPWYESGDSLDDSPASALRADEMFDGSDQAEV